jgi:hypothetical protein
MQPIQLDHNELVEVSNELVVMHMQPHRAHDLAHILETRVARALESAAVALADPTAQACAIRTSGTVPVQRRLAAAELLTDLPPLARVAVIDAASRWLMEDAGSEMAYALLAACASDTSASRAYLALLTP